jgi:hypothetical protein
MLSTRQRADLHRLAVEGRRLQPAVFAVVLEIGVVRRRFALVRVQRLVIAAVVVPGMLDRLGDAIGEVLVVEAGDCLEASSLPSAI